MECIKKNAKKGSALIITMLFGTVAMVLTVTLASFAMSDFKQIALIDESNTANYANDASTELAITAYRYNRDKSQIACIPSGPAIPEGASVYKDAFDLQGSYKAKVPGIHGDLYLLPCKYNQVTGITGTNANVEAKIISYYFKKTPINNLTAKKDEVRELAIPEISRGNDLQIKINSLNFNTSAPSGFDQFLSIESTQLDINNDQIKKDIQVDKTNNETITIPIYSTALKIRLRFIMYMRNNTVPFNDADFLPIDSNSSINYNLSIKDCSECLIDSGVTTIEATTEYGGAKRKKITEIDRMAGTIINQADFVIYGSVGGINLND